jgi:hypothetical protein
VIGTSQAKSANPASPLSSEAFEQLLRRAAANFAVLRDRSTCAGTISGSPELGPIGETAGVVWHMLSDQGPTTFALLIESHRSAREPVLYGYRVARPRKQNYNRAS